MKCGIALPIDGSRDGLINIRDLNNYSIPPWKLNPLLTREHLATVPPPDIVPPVHYRNLTQNVMKTVGPDDSPLDSGMESMESHGGMERSGRSA